MNSTLIFLNHLELFLNRYEVISTLFISFIGAFTTGLVGIISLFIALYTTNKTLKFQRNKQSLASTKLMDVLDWDSEELRRSINTVNLDYFLNGSDGDIIILNEKPLLFLQMKEKNTLEDIQSYIKLLKEFRNKNVNELTNEDSYRITRRLRILDSLDRRISIYLSYYDNENRVNLSSQTNRKVSIKPIRQDIQKFIDLVTQSFS